MRGREGSGSWYGAIFQTGRNPLPLVSKGTAHFSLPNHGGHIPQGERSLTPGYPSLASPPTKDRDRQTFLSVKPGSTASYCDSACSAISKLGTQQIWITGGSDLPKDSQQVAACFILSVKPGVPKRNEAWLGDRNLRDKAKGPLWKGKQQRCVWSPPLHPPCPWGNEDMLTPV